MLKDLQKACKHVNSAHKSCKDKFLEGQIELVAMSLHVITGNAATLKTYRNNKRE